MTVHWQVTLSNCNNCMKNTTAMHRHGSWPCFTSSKSSLVRCLSFIIRLFDRECNTTMSHCWTNVWSLEGRDGLFAGLWEDHWSHYVSFHSRSDAWPVTLAFRVTVCKRERRSNVDSADVRLHPRFGMIRGCSCIVRGAANATTTVSSRVASVFSCFLRIL